MGVSIWEGDKAERVASALEAIAQGGGGGGTDDYEELDNKPSINNVTLVGNKTLSDLGAASASDLSAKYTKPQDGIPASDLASGVIPTVHNVPAGGSAGQVLTKTSGTDYESEWATPQVATDAQVAEAVDDWLGDNVAQETGYVLDRTLLLSNAAAPADMVGTIKNEITKNANLTWYQGWYGASAGMLNVSQSTGIASSIFSYEISYIHCTSDYKFRVQAWEGTTYRGIWNGHGFQTSNPNYFVTDFNLAELENTYPNFCFAVVLFAVAGTAVTPSNGSNVTFKYNKALYIEKTNYQRSYLSYGGYNIAPKMNGCYKWDYDQAIPSIPTGTTSRQGGDIYNNKAYILASNDKASIVNFLTSTKITDIEITCGHGNSCQFANNVLTGEDTPRLYCFGYSDNNVYENSITNNVATLQKTYYLPIDGYRLSGGYDYKKNRFITIHYALDSSTDVNNNYCILSVWDLNNITNNNDGTYTPHLASQNKIPFIGMIQDCKVCDGLLYVLSGNKINTNYPATYIHCFNESMLLNSVEIFAVNGNEPEVLLILNDGTICIGDSRFHLFKFN